MGKGWSPLHEGLTHALPHPQTPPPHPALHVTDAETDKPRDETLCFNFKPRLEGLSSCRYSHSASLISEWSGYRRGETFHT